MGSLFLLFIGVPIAEIALFVYVGDRIGLLPALLLTVATALTGSGIVARQGAGAIARVQSAFVEARFPGRELAHGALIVFAGVLLITPGFLTDAAGFLLLVPPVREAARRLVMERYSDRWVVQSVPRRVDADWRDAGPTEPGQPPRLP